MEMEKSELLQLNLELQKKASNLLFRDKVSTEDVFVRSSHHKIIIAYLSFLSIINMFSTEWITYHSTCLSVY
jgi:hypothetical protein